MATVVVQASRTVSQIWAKCVLLDCLQYTPVINVVTVAIHKMMLMGMNWSTLYQVRCCPFLSDTTLFFFP